MGFKELQIKVPTNYSNSLIQGIVRKKLRIRNLSFEILNKSLDARKKNNIQWQLRLLVISKELKGPAYIPEEGLKIDYKKREKRITVVGSGPAGFFAAYVLQMAGFKVRIIERGTEVNKRAREIEEFESTGQFNSKSNYAFGEGGAGTFSDGKLTSRSKHISKERQFIHSCYVEAGAPEEILYMAHPHLGSDNLKIIVQNLREKFIALGGEVHFETCFTQLKIKSNLVSVFETEKGKIESDYYLLANGHSAFDTARMLIKAGVLYRTKNFAIGSRMEHPQNIINTAQWGCNTLAGVKAAEYRLSAKTDKGRPVYTFCMCPGGVIVPAAAYENTSIVNGMSLYHRNDQFANAACVAGIHLNELLNKEVDPLEAIDWLEALEQKFYEINQGYTLPVCSIKDFINGKLQSEFNKESSYPLAIEQQVLWEFLPKEISNAMRSGLKEFCSKLSGFEYGNIMGLESKTSAPIQVERDELRRAVGINNLFIIGEGSGYAGGIISSAADGIKAALSIIEMES